MHLIEPGAVRNRGGRAGSSARHGAGAPIGVRASGSNEQQEHKLDARLTLQQKEEHSQTLSIGPRAERVLTSPGVASQISPISSIWATGSRSTSVAGSSPARCSC